MKLLGYVLAIGLGLVSNLSHAESFEQWKRGKQLKQGYFPLYIDKQAGKVYLDVDKLEQDFLFQSSLPLGLGSNDIGLDRGQLGDTRIVHFLKAGDKVLLEQKNTYYRAISDNPAEVQAVNEAFTTSVLWGFKRLDVDGHNLIDYTPFVLSDLHGVSRRLADTNQGSFQLKAANSVVYFPRTKAFPLNTEIEAKLAFSGTKPGEYVQQIAPDPRHLSVHSRHSLIALPDDNYKPRVFHPYSGFWSVEYKDYAAPFDEEMTRRFIPRHRLAKKDPQQAVSEAVKPIVYYLDPGAPEPVRTALLDGARWWNQAFEAAGYKDAFRVEVLPVDADPMDVRYNVIQWVHRATRGWSYGASVIDPRTGEIIKGHVTLGSLRVRQDYLIAKGLMSPFGKEQAELKDLKAMALARIRQLSAHEVGHTLGLAHNFAASVNQRASVMDYPHPLVNLVGKQVSLSDAYAEGIGEWDKYTVAYGYSDFADKEAEALANLVSATQEKGLLYMSDPDARPRSGAHPHGHLWDNGQDPVAELDRVLKVRASALQRLGLDSLQSGEPLSNLQELIVPIYYYHRYQVEAASKLIAGVDYSYELKAAGGQQAKGAIPVEQAIQRKAIDGLINTIKLKNLMLSNELIGLVTPKAYGYSVNRESAPSQLGLVFDPVSLAEAGISHTLDLLLNPERLNRLAQQGDELEYLFNALISVINYRYNEKGLDLIVKNRQEWLIVDALLSRFYSDSVMPEVKGLLLANMNKLVRQYKLAAWQNRNNHKLNAHTHYIAELINQSLSKGTYHSAKKKAKLPPGSPI